MQNTSPNKGAAPNRRLRLGLMPWSFGTLTSQGSAVGELDRSAASNAGGVEQEPTEGTETDSILCFLCYLLFNSEAGCLATWTRISFRVFRVVGGYLLRAVTSPVATAFLAR